MTECKDLGTSEGTSQFLKSVVEIESRLKVMKEALAQQLDATLTAEVQPAQSAGPSRPLENTVTNSTETLFRGKLKFGVAEPSRIPIRAKFGSEEQEVLRKKLEIAVPDKPVGVNESFISQLLDGSLVVELANFLTSDLVERSGSYPNRFPKIIKAGSREVITLDIPYIVSRGVRLSYQITEELKLAVLLQADRSMIVALAPTQMPLGQTETNEYGDPLDIRNDVGDAVDARSQFTFTQLMLKTASDRSQIKIPTNELAIARHREILAGIRLTQRQCGGSVLQIGIVSGAQENPPPGGVCAVPSRKRKRLRQNEPANFLSVQGDTKYLVLKVCRLNLTARKSTGGVPPTLRSNSPTPSPFVQMTIQEILDKKFVDYGFVLEIENFLDVDLLDGGYYMSQGHAEPIPPRVKANEGEVAIFIAFQAGRNSGGVLAYRIGETDLMLAVAFRLINCGNVFAAAFVPVINVDKLLQQYLLNGVFWATSPDRKYGQAKDGELVIEVRNIRSRVTMLNDFKALMKVQIKTF